MDDYPAAHSMDTIWFAVDGAGHVAIFESDEEGHVPQGEENDVRSQMWQLHDASYDPETDYFSDEDQHAGRVGLFYFGYRYEAAEGVAGVYTREVVPERPLHVDQLPPALRDKVREILFPGVNFAEA